VLSATGWKPQVADADQRLSEEIETRLQRAGWTPPTLEELSAALGAPAARLMAALRLLAERGRVVRLDERVWMHRDAVDAGREMALQLFRRAPSFTTMDFRDLLGVSRKFAVPLLDHLDRLRFTVRTGNHRAPGAEAKKLLYATVSP
jgi:selenocysteine-specific elongation factor